MFDAKYQNRCSKPFKLVPYFPFFLTRYAFSLGGTIQLTRIPPVGFPSRQGTLTQEDVRPELLNQEPPVGFLV